MKTHLLILLCFILTIAARFVPVVTTTETIEDLTIQYKTALLTGLLPFILVGLLVAGIFLALAYYRYKQPLKGEVGLVRKDLNLLPYWKAMGIWVAVVLMIELLLTRFIHFFRGMAPYFVIILLVLLLYAFFLKWLMDKLRPVFITIDGDKIRLRGLFGNGRRKLGNCQSIDFNELQQVIVLRFEEGLEDITIYLSDYKRQELTAWLHELNRRKNNELPIPDSLQQAVSIP